MESVLNPIVPPVPIQFSKRITFRTGADGIDINAAVDPRLVAALLGNAPFPEGLEVPLSGVQIAASGGQDILFDGGKGTVKFAASVDSLASLGIYLDPAHLTKDSGTDQYFGDSLVLPALSTGYYLLLKWGYDASASGQGSVALGPATVQFGAEGKSGRRFSIIRKVTGNPAAPKALVDLLDSWTIPSLITKPADLQLGTWLFTETDGRLQGSLGVSYGYDFNWVREASLGGLSGDIGLKVQLGLDAALSVDISSAFAVVVNREADQVLRVRVFKQPKKGWQFALNAGATVNAVTPELPQNLDDFVLSILDLQNQQLLMDLKDLKSWVSGQAPLSGALAGIVPRYMEQLLQTVYTATTGKPFDFEQAKTRVLQFLDTWGGLDSKIASIIWNNIPDKTLVGQMADICRQITSCNAPADYAAFIDKVASQPAFLSSPSGQWLESLALGAILRPVESDATFAAIKNAAATASPFLADASSERALLEALHGWIDPRIGLPAIRKVANGIDLTQLDAWVKAKLQRFLDETVLSLTGVQKVQSMIQLLQSKAGSFYEHARKALSDTYTLSLSALYQTSSTSTAMFDVTFDFGDIKARPVQLQALVGELIAGNFRNVLGTSEPGVRINRSILTHGLSRHQHIELRMPFYHSTFDEINQSLAKVDSVGSDSGRMLVYQLDAKDDIGAITNRGASYSHLGLAATIVAPNNARKHSSPNFSYNYVYRAASDDMRRAQLQYQIGAYVDAYLGGHFRPVRLLSIPG